VGCGGKGKEVNFDTASEIEYRVAKYFDPRRNIIVPNVWWGWGLNHECDLVVLTKSGYAYEVEIKVSKSDLRADLKKRWGHSSKRLRRLYFAVPEKLESCALELVPKSAGILKIQQTDTGRWPYPGNVSKVREAQINLEARRLNPEEELKLAALGTMRIWTLKRAYSSLWERYENECNPHQWRMEYLG